MGPTIKALVELQSVENRLRAAKTGLSRSRRSVVVQESKIRSLQNTLEAKKEEIQLVKVQSDRLELELKTKEEALQKLRNSLNAAKSNKEYAAILTQLNTTKAENSKTETQVLEFMKDIETDEAELQEIKEQIDQEKTKLEQIRKDADTKTQKYQQDIDKIQKEWNEVAKDIPKDALVTFNRVAETYDGEALAIIEHQEGQSAYSCGGCFMGVTAESWNQVATKDDIIRCPNCTRILVLPPSEDV